jgi:DNA polymerase-2
MKAEKGFVVYPTYRVRAVDGNEKAFVYLYGRLENGESFLVTKHYRPYFCIKASDRKKAEGLVKAEYAEDSLKNFDGEKVCKVILWNPKDVPGAKQLLQDNKIACYEADIRFTYRFLIDNDIKGCIEIKGDFVKGSEMGQNVDRVYEEPEISATTFQPKLKVLSIDIETDGNATEIFSISLFTEGFRKVLIAKDGDFRNAKGFKDEKEMLERFREIVIQLDPDILTGWNFIDFDLKVIKERFSHYKIDFNLGRDSKGTSQIRLTDSFFMDSRADVTGRAVLDGIHLMKMSFMRVEDYKLNTVAKKILGKEKTIQQSETWKEEIENAFRKDPQRLIDYNLNDAEMVYEIIEKEKLVELTISRTMLTRMQLDRVNASVASFDSLYLKELQNRGYVANTASVSEADERIKGGFVRQSKPGIYENIIVLDFKSLYPSIMRTMNIDPLDFVRNEDVHKHKKSELIEAPNGAHFRKRDGILSELIQRLWEKRDQAKKQKNKLAANAIKILMNSLFGVLANPTCRFYSLDIANAITYFGQFFIKLCAEKIEGKGFEVIYGDTDSIFVNPKIEGYKKAVEIGEELQDSMNSFFRNYIEENYGRRSVLELEFEKVYKKFLMPKVRHSEEGAKKRYVGIVEIGGENRMEFVGLEFVRRDWTELAKKFQMGLLERIFRGEKIEGYINDFVDDLKDGKYDDLLIYRKAIRKSVDEYTKTTPPHIKAARLIGRKTSGLIEYYMTENGPEPVENRKSRIDYQHYIDKQIKPIADSVLVFFDRNFDDLIKGHKQSSLFDFK